MTGSVGGPTPHLVGLDIGGSKTHAAGSCGGCTRELLAGSANLSSVGEVEAGRQLDLIFGELAARPGCGPVTAVCAGAAGVDTPEGAERLRRLLAARAPGAVVHVVHDTQLILAAAGVTTGIALISGTGSVAWGCDQEGRTARAGGWGYLLGDEGSGYGIARDAVRHVLRAADEGRAPDRLAQHLVDACGLCRPAQLLDHFYAQPERRYWARHAGLVFALAGDGDEPSTRIVDDAAAALVALVLAVGRRIENCGPVVLAGGLAVHQPALQDRLRSALGEHGYDDVRVLDRDPVHGALALAQAHLDTTSRS